MIFKKIIKNFRKEKKMRASDFKHQAKQALSGNWLKAILAAFVASIFGATSTSGSGSINVELPADSEVSTEELFAQLGIPEEMIMTVLAIVGAILVFASVYALFVFIFGSAVGVGYAQFNLNLVDNRESGVGDLFSKFGMIGKAILTNLLGGLYIMLWSLLFVIPGIVATYSYSMTNYILAENPTISASDALKESKRIMKGNRWRLFCLELSFIGWAILCVFTLGIGYFFLAPYMEAARAAFYREVKRESVYSV